MTALATYTAACGCTRFIVDTLEETLDCPSDWTYQAGTGWIHGPVRTTLRRKSGPS